MTKETKSSQEILHSQKLASIFFSIVTVLFIGFIFSASLTHGDKIHNFFPLEPSFTWMFNQSIREASTAHDLRDISTNILLYIPLGVFLSLTLSCYRVRYFTLWLLFGTLVSYGVETAQQYIERYPDIIDLITNTSGYLAGFFLAAFAVDKLKLRPGTVIGLGEGKVKSSQLDTFTALRFLYVSIYIIVALLPFDVTVSLTKIMEKMVPDEQGVVRIILDPFYHLRTDSADRTSFILGWLGLVPVAVLSALIAGLKRRLNPLSPIMRTFFLAVFCEGAQVFIASRTSDIIFFPIAFAAGIFGWLVAKIWFLADYSEPSSKEESEVQGGSLWGWLVMLYAIFLCFMAWAPFDFELNSRQAVEKLVFQSNIIPFLSHFRNRDLSAALDLVKETGLFVPFGILLAGWVRARRNEVSKIAMVFEAEMYCVLFAVFLELSQSLCVGRYSDVTDIVLAAIGGFLGALSMKMLKRARRKS